MSWFRFDPANYSVGSDLWIAQPRGWRSHTAERFTVEKISPSGQLTVVAVGNADRRLKLTVRGKIVGAGQWDHRSVIDADEAAELLRDHAARKRRDDIAKAATDLAYAANRGEEAGMREHFAALATAMSAFGQDPQGLEAKPASAVAATSGETPNLQPILPNKERP